MLVLQYTNTLLIHSLKKKQQLPCPAVHRGLPHSSVGKESVCNAGDLGSIPVLGRSPGEENGNPFQYSCLEKFSIEMLNYNGSSVTLNHALKTFVGTSLMVQFLRLLSVQAVWVQSLVMGLRSKCLLARKPKHKTEAIFEQIQ